MRLINADSILQRVKGSTASKGVKCLAEVLVATEPTIDAVVVTRCKDCKHSTLPSELTQRDGKPGTLTCHNMHAPSNRRNVGSDDFCSYGEPKEG